MKNAMRNGTKTLLRLQTKQPTCSKRGIFLALQCTRLVDHELINSGEKRKRNIPTKTQPVHLPPQSYEWKQN